MKCGGCGENMVCGETGFECADCKFFVPHGTVKRVVLAEPPAYTNLRPPPILKEGRFFRDQ